MPQVRNIHIFSYALIFLGYLTGMFLDIQEIDAAQYAVMSRDMLASGDFLQLYDRGNPYLDKPPLTFWMTALSYAAFGVSNFSYKLPSVLFSLLAIFSTGRLARKLHGEQVGAWAALVLASCQAFFLMNNDVKTDMYLIGAMSLAVWQLVEFNRGGAWWHVPIAFVGIGLGMLAKGPLGFVAPIAAVGADMLLRRDWRGIFRWQWLLGLPVLALVLLPFSLGQYAQYGWEGVKFFYWTQSFGRITGQSEWTNDATAFFFVHTMAWSFLPWVLLFVVALGGRTWAIARGRLRLAAGDEGVAWAGFVLVFAALAMSRFKLPHYIFVTYPFAALMVARLWVDLSQKENLRHWLKRALAFHAGQYVILLLAMSFLSLWAFPEHSLWLKLPGLLLGTGVAAWAFWEKRTQAKFMLFTAAGVAALHVLLNLALYPPLLKYQSTAQAGKYISAHAIPLDRFYAYASAGRALDFYTGRVTQNLESIENALLQVQAGPIHVYTDKDGIGTLDVKGLHTAIVDSFPHFKVNRITLPFINPAIRPKVVKHRYLIQLSSQP